MRVIRAPGYQSILMFAMLSIILATSLIWRPCLVANLKLRMSPRYPHQSQHPMGLSRLCCTWGKNMTMLLLSARGRKPVPRIYSSPIHPLSWQEKTISLIIHHIQLKPGHIRENVHGDCTLCCCQNISEGWRCIPHPRDRVWSPPRKIDSDQSLWRGDDDEDQPWLQPELIPTSEQNSPLYFLVC